MNEMKIFKKISIGGIDKNKLIKKLIDQGIRFNEYANKLFEHPSFVVNDDQEYVNLVKVSLHDLKIIAPCTFKEIISEASHFQLRQCPIWLGPFLRLDYLEQPEGPYLTIASKKPENDERYPNGFYVRHYENSLWLRGYRADDDYQWPLDSEFVFLQ